MPNNCSLILAGILLFRFHKLREQTVRHCQGDLEVNLKCENHLSGGVAQALSLNSELSFQKEAVTIINGFFLKMTANLNKSNKALQNLSKNLAVKSYLQ